MRTALLRWYDRSARDLPWRRTLDPYAIWVSEVMLQQTRVDTVLRYYARFLERFPDAQTLACASEEEVMAAWSGLGYYRRARLLHGGVREVVARYGGAVPEDADARRALPGVGRYTAGAIGSIAFDRTEPVVDGNVARVLTRVHGIASPLGRADTERQLWDHAEALVKGARPGALNQALMELGATVCTKHRPTCVSCPVRASCVARVEGRQDSLPVPRPRAAPRQVALTALVATHGSAARGAAAVWLERGSSGLFAGLWNLPTAEGHGRAGALELQRQHGVGGRLSVSPVARIEHVLTHRRMELELWRATGARAEAAPGLRAVALHALDAGAISALTRKALAACRLSVATQRRT